MDDNRPIIISLRFLLPEIVLPCSVLEGFLILRIGIPVGCREILVSNEKSFSIGCSDDDGYGYLQLWSVEAIRFHAGYRRRMGRDVTRWEGGLCL